MQEQEKNNKGFLKGALLGFAVLMIFSFGYGFGSGNIQFFRGGQNNNLPANLQYGSVEKLYDTLRRQYDGELSEDALLDGLKKGLVSATGDPYTEYLTAEQTTEFDESLNGTFSGIGAELSKEEESIIIVAPISGFPAEREGLQPKDVILKVDGESIYGIGVSEAVDKIRGPEGTEVTLTILRGGEEKEFTITRENITIPSVESRVLDGNIGLIEITRFSDDTARLVQQAAEEFAQKDVKGVIVDVRSNPGGLLDAAVDVASVWLPDGTTVLEERRGGEVIKTYQAKDTTTLKDVPTVVLINEGSASASEILAGALHDNNAATLLGVTSFGKGSVQTIERFSDGSSLKVTIARWFTPDGKNIDKEGIEPDKTVKQNTSSETDEQLDAAIKELTN